MITEYLIVIVLLLIIFKNVGVLIIFIPILSLSIGIHRKYMDVSPLNLILEFCTTFINEEFFQICDINQDCVNYFEYQFREDNTKEYDKYDSQK